MQEYLNSDQKIILDYWHQGLYFQANYGVMHKQY